MVTGAGAGVQLLPQLPVVAATFRLRQRRLKPAATRSICCWQGRKAPDLPIKNENNALPLLFHNCPHDLRTDKLLCFHPGVAGYSSRFHSQNILPDYILVRGTFIHSRQGDGRLLAFQTQSSFDLARLFLAGRYGLFSADRGPLGFLEIAQPLVSAFPFSHHSKLRKSKTGCRPGCYRGCGYHTLSRLY